MKPLPTGLSKLYSLKKIFPLSSAVRVDNAKNTAVGNFSITRGG
jgi:hypothetical protein